MARCSPHEWRTPAVADAALVCDVCECRLDLANDIAPAAQAEIVGGLSPALRSPRGPAFRGGAGGCGQSGPLRLDRVKKRIAARAGRVTCGAS